MSIYYCIHLNLWESSVEHCISMLLEQITGYKCREIYMYALGLAANNPVGCIIWLLFSVICKWNQFQNICSKQFSMIPEGVS